MHSVHPVACVRPAVIFALLVVGLLAAIATGAQAAIGSQTAIIYADAGRPDDSGDGRSWASAKKSLQTAIDVASASGGEVWVKAGTYKEKRTTADGALVLWSNVQLYGGFAGNELLRDQRDPAAHPTIISGSQVRNGQSAYHVIRMESTLNCRIDGFTLTGITPSASGSEADECGGGIYGTGVNETNLIANCVVSNNSVSSSGAGMYFSNSSPVLDHCTFRNNLGTESGGGICYVNSPGRKMPLTDCTFSGNMGTMGGGLYVKSAAVELTGCTFTGNSASPYGGGVLLWYAEPSRFERCTFSGNTANFSGGAIRCQFTPFTSINCVFSGNASQYGSGGALSIIQASSGSAPQVINCTMINNTARDGGAIMTLVTSTSSAPLIQNTIFTGNTGKAIYEYDSSSDPIVRNCLFFNNPDGDYLDEGMLDTGNEGGVVKTGAAAINALFGAGGVQNRGNVSGDPKLTGLYHLGAGSLAIDQGDATGAPANDIESGRRPVDIAGIGIDGAGAIDIGASEFDAILPPVFITQPFAQAVDLHGSATLSVAVTGTEQITCLWFRGGVALPDATSSTLKLTDASLADEGDYYCRAYNLGGVATSRTVRVEVLTPGTLVASPLALNFPKGTRWAVDVENGGAPTTQTLTLANAGEKPLTFTAGGPATPGLALAGTNAADFQIVTVTPATTAPLPSRGVLTVTVKFAPHQAKRTLGLSAQLLVTTDSPVMPVLTIPLQGDAVPVELSGFKAE